jgi:putative hemolysin
MLFFLVGSFFLTAVISAFRRMYKKDSQRSINSLGPLFFYRPFHRFFIPKNEYEGLFFTTICAQNLARFGYAACGIIFLSQTELFHPLYQDTVTQYLDIFWIILSILFLILGSFVVGDFLPRIFGTRFPEKALQVGLPLSSPYLFLSFPLAYIFLKISQSSDLYFDYTQEPSAQAKQEIIELIQEAEVSPTLDIHDKKLIESVLTFKERCAREVMVPRVDVFSLSVDTSIKEAARLLQNEGYSRTPVYRNSVDNIVGVLMYKDVLRKYMEYEEKKDPKILEAPIETIQKNILYTPETKKISSLLQDFRKKQVHLAIVVDEYGGTEGIITIEDILEEIVGEISDEYDQEEEPLKKLPDGSWILDAKMNIFDVEELLDIQIPQEEEYDTVGGYVFHVAGAIPSPGFIIHHDDFELEILESSDRSVEKVRIKPFAQED